MNVLMNPFHCVDDNLKPSWLQLNTKKSVAKRLLANLRLMYLDTTTAQKLCYLVPEISTKKIAKLLGDNEKMVLEVYSHIVEER